MLLPHGRLVLTENVQNKRDFSGQSLVGYLDLLKILPNIIIRVHLILRLTSVTRHEGHK
jgi:hypothetical protein